MFETVAGDQQQLPILWLRSESGEKTVHYPLIYDDYPEEFERMAQKELGETHEKKMAGIQKLREIIKKKDMPKLDENTLVAVLRASKYNMEKSEAKLKNFVAKRQDILEMVAAMDMKIAEIILDDLPVGLLPYRTSNGAAVLYTRPYGLKNMDLYGIDDVLAVGLSCCLFLVSHPITSVGGFVYFGECKTPSCALLYQVLRRMRQYMWHLLAPPMRLSKVEVLNEINIVHFLYKITKPFLPEKIYKRFDFHGNSKDRLKQLYHPSILPDEFGGNMGPLSNNHYKQIVLDYIMELKAERMQDLKRH